jgi:hypothetical protein
LKTVIRISNTADKNIPTSKQRISSVLVSWTDKIRDVFLPWFMKWRVNKKVWCLFSSTCLDTKVNQKVNAIFKLRGDRYRGAGACAVLTVPVEEFSHLQYSTLPSVEWQQRGRKHGCSFARWLHRRTTWRRAVS